MLVTIFALFLLCGVAQCAVCKPPEGSPACVCDTPKGRVDLTTVGNNDGKARFTGMKDNYDYTYQYNPCYAFGYGDSACRNGTAACQMERFGGEYQCGAMNSEAFIINEKTGEYSLEYSIGQNGRTTIVKLHCDKSASTPRVTAQGDSQHYLVYTFDLYTECACPGRCHGRSSSGYNSSSVL